MALADVVIMSAPLVQPIAPLRGTVVNVPGGGTSDVLWENGKRTNGLDDNLLRKVFDPADLDQSLADLVGRWVQVRDWPLGDGDGVPKSPGAMGIVRRAYGQGDVGAAQPDPTGAVEIELFDGRGQMFLLTGIPVTDNLTVLGRRKVQEL